ncbi:hypothetical protein [Desulfosporosinus sp. OT]|uniref:hypothetical protein n=1 Tax=Desulfosporosinus sp. OT TaxID=913865 RepID=UPI000223AA97|nr:hypothetical protein [Desulfosporosinus sp. OT]EGW38901.1 hypothetical protein DOT_3076 [Desulfosporosinus sp. OT]
MLVRRMKSKQNLHRIIMISLIACILCIGFGIHNVYMGMPSKDTLKTSQMEVPLLLNSEVVLAEEAEVNVILWFEDGEIPLEIWTKKPMPNWNWDYKELKTGNGNVAVTISGHCFIDKNEESNLYSWYTIMAQQMAKTDGHIYLDERVPQLVDIASYLSKTNALPSQWALQGDMVSIAGYQSNFNNSVIAGQDLVNIQLLSRGKNTEGQTVLAMPVLLEEF